MVPVPYYIDLKNPKELYKEFEIPTALDLNRRWKFYKIVPSRQLSRKRSMNELLFCMLRSKHRN